MMICDEINDLVHYFSFHKFKNFWFPVFTGAATS